MFFWLDNLINGMESSRVPHPSYYIPSLVGRDFLDQGPSRKNERKKSLSKGYNSRGHYVYMT